MRRRAKGTYAQQLWTAAPETRGGAPIPPLVIEPGASAPRSRPDLAACLPIVRGWTIAFARLSLSPRVRTTDRGL